MIDIEGLHLTGYSLGISPYQIFDNFDPKPGKKRTAWVSLGPHGPGSILAADRIQRDTMEWEIPLRVYPRFLTAYTNLHVNPRLWNTGTTGYAARGSASIARTTDEFLCAPAALQVTTTAAANDGCGASFTATTATHSGTIRVLAPDGAPMSANLEGSTAVVFTGTGEWQEVKVEGASLSSGTRQLRVYQTDATARTFYVELPCITQTSTAVQFFDGQSGDAVWNGAAHASTSTCKTGQDAVSLAIGRLSEKANKAEAQAHSGGVPMYWKPTGASARGTLDLYTMEGVTPYDRRLDTLSIAETKITLISSPYIKGEEYLAATISKPAGTSALVGTISDCQGDVPGPCRLVFNNPGGMDLRFLALGMQYRTVNTGLSLTLPATGFTTSGYSGTPTAAVNEVQTLSKSGTISGGNYTLTMDGKTTGSIAHNANAATIQAALDALANVEAGDIVVTGGPISTTTVTFTFAGNYAGRNIGTLGTGSPHTSGTSISVTSSLTGGGTVAMNTTTAGFPAYVSTALYAEWTTICALGALGHVGDYRVLARVYDNAVAEDTGTASLRLTWGTGDLASVDSNPVVSPVAVGDFSIVDLGQVHIDEAQVGTQQWNAYVEAKTSGTAGNTLLVVEVVLIPLEVFSGDTRTPVERVVARVALDSFDQTAGNLVGKTATLGGSWTAGYGDGDDYTIDTTNDRAQRTTVSDSARRLDVFGSTNYSSVEVVGTVRVSATTLIGIGGLETGVAARIASADVNNFCHLALEPYYLLGTEIAAYAIALYVHVGGSRVALRYSGGIGAGEDVPITLFLRAYASGLLVGHAEIDGQVVAGPISVFHSSLASGGALASGKPGVIDYNLSSLNYIRNVDDFNVYSLSGDTPTVFAGQDLHVRQDGQLLRESSTNDLYGVPGFGAVTGLPTLGPAGPEGLSNRIAAMPSRFNPDFASDPFPDGLACAAYHTPVFEFANWAG